MDEIANTKYRTNDVIGENNGNVTLIYKNNATVIVSIKYNWQTVNVHADRTFTTAEISEMVNAFYRTTFIFTRMFNFTKESFEHVKLSTTVDVFAFENESTYEYMIVTLVGHTNPGNSCGLQFMDKIFIALTRCSSYITTMFHEYSHYLNAYLLNLPSVDRCWKRGTCRARVR
ncbi:hypothetical protein AGLY_011579 [Aphis glycines]|uniref:Uncharacterized protein n=1 Tax=Aphis glycines TaxID=307491 RepID=A0A6G0TCB8_APHGL|nr:hypothetical protein AGLY_011579 [Aphis glycines]